MDVELSVRLLPVRCHRAAGQAEFVSYRRYVQPLSEAEGNGALRLGQPVPTQPGFCRLGTLSLSQTCHRPKVP